MVTNEVDERMTILVGDGQKITKTFNRTFTVCDDFDSDVALYIFRGPNNLFNYSTSFAVHPFDSVALDITYNGNVVTQQRDFDNMLGLRIIIQDGVASYIECGVLEVSSTDVIASILLSGFGGSRLYEFRETRSGAIPICFDGQYRLTITLPLSHIACPTTEPASMQGHTIS